MQNYNLKFKILTFLSIISIFAFSNFNFVDAAGLVPCSGVDCTWCKLGELFVGLMNFLIYLIFPLGAVMIVVGGIFMMTSGGAPARFAKGKEIATAAVIGILIALLSWLIIDTIIKVVAVGWDNVAFGPWNKIDLCRPL